MAYPLRCIHCVVARHFTPFRQAVLVSSLIVFVVLLSGCGPVSSILPSGGASATLTPTPRPTFVYVAIGASETFGYGADRPATQSYPEDLGAHLPRGAQVINLGIPGETASGALQGELPEALDAKPDLVTVWLGTNDIKDKVPLDNFQRDLDTILTQLATGTHARIAVANLPDLTLLPYFYTYNQLVLKAKVKQWNAAISQEVAAHHAILIDMYANSPDLIGHPEYLSGDGLHPSTLGYQLIATLFYEVLHTNGVI
jgi:lysophospholipase L1-like esterase